LECNKDKSAGKTLYSISITIVWNAVKGILKAMTIVLITRYVVSIAIRVFIIAITIICEAMKVILITKTKIVTG